eukprot:TRINITY_DN88625_c0_g1_i1.p2 TRINITY_DN88625_c0_g1~~TRINITY_DN88625_c0_g1_i1.p2  ORF type:complete len:371 (+),score=34.25 TRINITY_DN88625_c0_g1_i1:1523-2635(+)
MSSRKEDPKDDSVLKPIDKSISEDNPTERIEIDKIQLPEGLGQNDEDRGSSLFKNEPSFTYEKNALQQSQGKFGIPEDRHAGENSSRRPSHKSSANHQSILDKYKERLEKAKEEVKKEESKEGRRELRRQQTLKKKQLEKEMQTIREKMEVWSESIDSLASTLRFIALLFITLMGICFLFFLFRKFGDNRFILWFGLEIIDQGIIVVLSYVTVKVINLIELDLDSVLQLKWWIYILGGMHLVMLIIGFVFMKYSGGFSMSGSRIEQSESLYRILGVVYIVLNVVKSLLLGYWLYLYKRYLPLYEEYYDKGTSDPTVAIAKNKEGSEDNENANRAQEWRLFQNQPCWYIINKHLHRTNNLYLVILCYRQVT